MPRRVYSQQHVSRNLPVAEKDQIAKILVFSQQQPVLVARTRYHLRIGGARRDLHDVADIVPGFTQSRDERGVHALIGEPAHGFSQP
jgi:hypothetical protein